MDFNRADDQEPGGGRGRAGARAAQRQPRDLPRAPAARAARPGAAAARSLGPSALTSPAPRRRARRAAAAVQGAAQQPQVSAAAFSRVLDRAVDEAKRDRGRLRLDRAPAAGARRRPARRAARVDQGGARRPARHLARIPEGTYQALQEVRPRPDRARPRPAKLDPVIGRDEEIRRVIQVLSRRTKNNPVLIGEPGVGKTAIVEGLAQRIVAGDVPEGLKGTRVWALDIGALLAGLEVPRRVRGAAEGGARRDQERRGPDHPLHRRAAHDRRRGRGRGRRRTPATC